MLIVLGELMLFPKYSQQFCFRLAGGYQQVQALFVAELSLVRASRSIVKTGSRDSSNGGSENEVETYVEKLTPKGPQMDFKRKSKSTINVFWRGSKRDVKKVPSAGPGKVRSGCYLLQFSKVRAAKNVLEIGTHFMRCWVRLEIIF